LERRNGEQQQQGTEGLESARASLHVTWLTARVDHGSTCIQAPRERELQVVGYTRLSEGRLGVVARDLRVKGPKPVKNFFHDELRNVVIQP